MTLASREAGSATPVRREAPLVARDGGRGPSRLLAVVALLTAITTYSLIVVGGVVRTTGSGLGCGASGGRNDWPFCRGGLLPPLEQHAVIEFSHRWLAAVVVVAALALLALTWGRYRHLRALTVTASLFSVFLVLQVVLGAVTVYNLLPPEVVMVHLANAELLLGCAVLITVLSVTDGGRGLRARAAAAQPAVRRAAWWAVAAATATFLLVLSGAFVVAKGAGADCAGWPLCGNGIQLSGDRLAAYNLGHRVVAAVVAALLALAVMRAVRAWRGVGVIRGSGVAVGLMLLAQIVAGAVLVSTRLPAGVRSLHEALASGLWAAVVLLAILVRPGLLGGSRAPDRSELRGRSAATAGCARVVVS